MGRERGGKWEVDGCNFWCSCPGGAYGKGSLHFRGPPGMGEGGGRGMGNGWAQIFDQVSCLARCTHSVVIAMADARLWRAKCKDPIL